MSTTLTVRIPDELAEKISKIAASTRRTKSFVAGEAMRSYVDHELSIIEDIEAGLADIKAGRVIPHEDVMRWLESWGTANELPAPRYRKKAG